MTTPPKGKSGKFTKAPAKKGAPAKKAASKPPWLAKKK